MSNRRKEMWKLLYNLVNRHEANLLDVCSVVDDILCQQASLISCASVDELNNKFQDTFVLWLLNKFAKWLSESTNVSQSLKNVELQQKILASSWANHPKLYENLVLSYVEALQQLNAQLSELDYVENKLANKTLELHIFTSDCSCLQEFDAQCCFQTIVVHIDNADAFAKHLLSVLQHAHTVGYPTHGELFVNSLAQALTTLKECDMEAKLASLRYCHAVLKAQSASNWLNNAALPHYGLLTLRALSLMWSMAAKWFMAKCLTLIQMQQLTELTRCLLKTLQDKQFHAGEDTVQLSCDMLREILFLRMDTGVERTELLHALSVFVQKQLQLMPTTSFLHTQRMLQLLLQQWRKQPAELVPVLVILAVREPTWQQLIVEELRERLCQLLSQTYAHKLQDLQEILVLLRAFKQLELLILLRYQRQATANHHLSAELLAQLPQRYELPLGQSDWMQQVTKYMEQQPGTNPLFQSTHIEICSMLLQVSGILCNLKLQLQHKLLAVLINSKESELSFIRLLHLFAIKLESPSSTQKQLQGFYNQHYLSLITCKDKQLMQLFCANLPQLYIAGYIKNDQLLEAMPQAANNTTVLAAVLRLLMCTDPSGNIHAFKVDDKVVLYCSKCCPMPDALPGIHLSCCKHSSKTAKAPLEFSSETLAAICQNWLFEPDCDFIAQHLDLLDFGPSLCLQQLQSAIHLNGINLYSFEFLVQKLATTSGHFIQQLATHMLERIVQILQKPLAEQSPHEQRQMLRLLVCCAHPDIEELWLFHWFKMTFYFLVHTNSLVAQEAVLSANQMCAKHGLQTVTLWNWYKRDALGLAIQLAMHVYLSEGVRFTRSLRALTKMLGFSCVQEFTCKYHRLLTTMVLPYCIKEPRCKGVIVLIAKQLRKPVSALFATSFLRLYTHVYLSESVELGNRCIELVVNCTQSSLHQLMNADVKQTVAELLIYFNRNPTFVMRSFQCLLQLATGDDVPSHAANAEFASFIAERFLGVITYFESCLSEPSFEKPLKEQTLYSLGQIMRFVGAQHVTQFRFKIIAMLSFVHTLQEPKLQRICLKIWDIFLHVVNVQELGPSLGRIVATLQPLLADNVEKVNSLYEFVILRNASMLGNYITDLYFLKNEQHVSEPTRLCITHHTAQQGVDGDKVTLLDQLRFMYKQISDECLQVRIYGLQHLAELFGQQRAQVNRMILHELPMEPLLEQTLSVLMQGCQHNDRKLQQASAKCLGQLGAIDASYLPSNYNFDGSQQLPLSVLTDDFAVLALTALCHGYQFQQKTKHVDSYSLAIQETLAVCGISIKERKKLDVWESLPARMRQIMQPLLHSCYTSSQRPSSCKQQPIFGSHYTHNSYEEWAFIWAARLIDYMQASETRHLLNSYKPCIKRDGKMLSIFYPYILLHALLDCNSRQCQDIEEEFLAVLSAASDDFQANTAKAYAQSSPSTEGSTGYKLYESKKYAATSVKTQDSESERVQDGAHIVRLASKLCAELLDFLQRWLREWQRKHGLTTGGKPPESVDSSYRSVHDFLQRIDKLLVARASYNCGEYARALSYLEDYIEQDKTPRFLEQFSFLVELYGRLMDADSVEGAVQARKYDMNVTQEILVNRLVERQQDMITCYEQLLCTEQLQPEHIRAMIDTYLRMDTPKTALLIADGLWQRLADQYTEQYFSECKAELLWRLGSYDELEQLQLQQQPHRRSNWHAQCAQACLALRQPDTTPTQFDSLLDGMRGGVLEQLRSCSATQQHSYAHAYDEVVKLHLLHELNCSQQLLGQLSVQLDESAALELMRAYFADWQQRLQILQPQLRVLEPIYSFRRNLLKEMQHRLAEHHPSLGIQLQAELARLWLSSAQINRKAGQLQRAQLYIMKAAEYKPSGLFLERARLLWEKGDQVMALHYLEEQLMAIKQQSENGNLKLLSSEQRTLYFEGKYLQAIYNAESMHLCAESILRYFHEAIAVQRQSERCYVQLAQFMEKMRDARQPKVTSAQKQGDDQSRQLLIQIMVNYAKSLRYGSEHVYQSMPRLISLWLDTAAVGADADLLRKMNDLLSNCCKALPAAIFYTAYSQLLSRLCHPSPDVFNVLRDIIVILIENYPQQSLWMLLPHFKSAVTNRAKRCKLIFTDIRLMNSSFQRLMADFNALSDRLIELTNKEVAIDRTYQLSELDKRLSRLFAQADFSNILLPFEKYMQPTFPISSASESNALDSTQPAVNWFPYQQIYINGFEEQVTVLRSAAKPKKLTIRCSDGQNYDIMVKPKDDMRKDARLMEFNGVVKRYLHQDAAARQRRLRIRTYAVLPFNEECGLLEWLPRLNSYRAICQSFYQQRGKGLGGRKLQQLALPTTESQERKRQVFLEKLLPAYPPVFQEWFRLRFSTPHSWYEARNAYIRTVAVMSMVGYILGLGDRHGENILFDESSGDAVHVDFNCLFNQGETFAYPEVVPFRLTQNMIAAMGPLGVEGSFRKCCEITLRLLKQETKTLMSVLRPLVYDLGRSAVVASMSSSRTCTELTDPKATNDVQRIAERLQGHVKRHQANSIPLSTEGQVNFLINEATDVDNLAAMYIGWGAYL